jgi:hypothetical protein
MQETHSLRFTPFCLDLGLALETAARAHLRRGDHQATKAAAQRSMV